MVYQYPDEEAPMMTGEVHPNAMMAFDHVQSPRTTSPVLFTPLR
jgi:hypothetical protein